jgi:hypothetical protein
MAPTVTAVSSLTPTFQLQRIMDTSLLWERDIDSKILEEHMPPFRNLNSVHHLTIGDHFQNGVEAGSAIAIEFFWMLAAYIVALLILRSKERE